MMWHQNKETRQWHAEVDGHKLRIQQSRWGNSTTPAWAIYIDGKPHGKELTLGDAKAEAKRELRSLEKRANF